MYLFLFWDKHFCVPLSSMQNIEERHYYKHVYLLFCSCCARFSISACSYCYVRFSLHFIIVWCLCFNLLRFLREFCHSFFRHTKLLLPFSIIHNFSISRKLNSEATIIWLKHVKISFRVTFYFRIWQNAFL